MTNHLDRWKAYKGNLASAVFQRPDRLIGWYRARRHERKDEAAGIEEKVLQLGEWLKGRDYKGADVDVWNPWTRLSTTYGFSLIGWLNLYGRYANERYLAEAEHCLDRLLSLQGADGSWLFPYAFGGNPSNFPYACENFMTLRALFRYCEEIGPERAVAQRINKALKFMTENIGYDDGIFWYSPSHRYIEEIPNISSMAASTFAKAYLMLNDSKFLKRAQEFATYCVSKQTEEGAFVYLAGEDTVYVPYHALEVSELKEANEILERKNIAKAIAAGVAYLGRHFQQYHYSSHNTDRGISVVLFKTPLWMARAYLVCESLQTAVRHYKNAIDLFAIPDEPHYFSMVLQVRLGGRGFYYPALRSSFMRYNASCFEIGSELLRKYQGAGC